MTVTFNGTTYANTRDGWASCGVIAEPALQTRLTTEFLGINDIDELCANDISELANVTKSIEDYMAAKELYEMALKRDPNDIDNIRYTLPCLSSCYRKLGKPVEAIRKVSGAITYYGSSIESSAMYCSYAAAFCDIGNFFAAKSHCDTAYRKAKYTNNARSICCIKKVYQRIDREIGN